MMMKSIISHQNIFVINCMKEQSRKLRLQGGKGGKPQNGPKLIKNTFVQPESCSLCGFK